MGILGAIGRPGDEARRCSPNVVPLAASESRFRPRLAKCGKIYTNTHKKPAIMVDFFLLLRANAICLCHHPHAESAGSGGRDLEAEQASVMNTSSA